MASEEHKQLAAYIKSIHRLLRVDSQKVGCEEAWRHHCSRKEMLEKYAASMQKLATKYWQQNDESKCRIQWVVKKCLSYFVENGRGRERLREHNREARLKYMSTKPSDKISHEEEELTHCSEGAKLSGRLTQNGCDDKSVDCSIPVSFSTELQFPNHDIFSLLDVGSCYNPFRVFPFFKVLAIDLSPASPDVLQCDFLDVKVDKTSEIPWDEVNTGIESLPEESFDTVIFSLLLEYLPSPQQRYECCKKAYSLLKPEGLLFIITPDSKHASANSSTMKNWRTALGLMGFSRVFYEKLPHLHCMAYRKNCNHAVARHWAMQTLAKHQLMLEDVSSLMSIPQDSHQYSDEEDEVYVPRSEEEDKYLADAFAELPEV
ncbi:S-adenosylmethionine sensor upstream of mTORC1 [Anabrus simplex]|uniref:S-adenosylmethionine sensor upstream of mTORC1 n=1 Tax=Anabrus simplex TaxID=316456 RepID=UPI0035A34BDB